MLAFNMELERVFAPQLFVGAKPGSARFGLGVLAEGAEARVWQGRVVLIAHTAPDQTKVIFEPREDPHPHSTDAVRRETFTDCPRGGDRDGARFQLARGSGGRRIAIRNA